MAITPEEVVINIIAKDNTQEAFTSVKNKLTELSQLATDVFNKVSKINNNVGGGSSSRRKGSGSNDNVLEGSRLEDFDSGKSGPKITDSPKGHQSKIEDFDKSPKFGSKLQEQLNASKSVFSKVINAWNAFDRKFIDTSSIPNVQAMMDSLNGSTRATGDSINNINKYLKNAGQTGVASANKISSAFSVSRSTFHELNNLLIAVGGQFTNLATSIAGLFGANSLGGMIEKMWKGASERQTNMLYLMHQKGVEQANAYYSEIMDIVTQLPGDDTFLTNILNMASAMDSSIKLDNLKELGSTITDYYIASTMKGELPFETQKDLRKYLTTGETKSLRNSLIANEIDLLKNKNSVLERGQALEEALNRNGFDGMSRYESATNALEEFKGHFQKAFADLGTIVINITQPLMKFYNTLDTLFGSRMSQVIIVLATVLIGFFTIMGTGMIITSVVLRNFEMLGMALHSFVEMTRIASSSQSILNAIIMTATGINVAEGASVRENIRLGMAQMKATYLNIISKKAHTIATSEQTISIWGLIGATGTLIKEKIMGVAITIKEIIFGVDKVKLETAEWLLTKKSIATNLEDNMIRSAQNTITRNAINLKLRKIVAESKELILVIRSSIANIIHSDSSLMDAISEEINTLSKKYNTIAIIRNTLAKLGNAIQDAKDIGIKLAKAVITWITTEATFSEALAHEFDAIAKALDTEATIGLAIATAILNAEMLPIIIIIGAIVVGIIALIVVIKKVGDAFGVWKWIGSVFQSISDGVKRLWNAFRLSAPVQGIIQYFTDFIDTIKEVIGRVWGLISAILGIGNSGSFDVVQGIINLFGKVGEAIMWVWNLLDDFSNSPLGIITWLNPLGILLFHLDEIGSFFEDIRDAIDIFMGSSEFQEFLTEIGNALNELREPFQEVWDAIMEVVSAITEAFGVAEDPKGKGTQERINLLVEILKGLVFILRNVLVPVIKAVAFAIRIVLTPLRVVLFIIKAIVGAIQWATGVLNIFGIAWEIISAPIKVVQSLLEGVGAMIKYVSDGIKNSLIGKLLGWDKESDDTGDEESKVKSTKNRLYDSMKKGVEASNMNFVAKQQILGELDKQNLTSNNVNSVHNLGSTYNHTNNQRQVIVNNHFSEGSMPIDARNMTKKEAKKMFIGAFGYRRAVGYNGIIR